MTKAVGASHLMSLGGGDDGLHGESLLADRLDVHTGDGFEPRNLTVEL